MRSPVARLLADLVPALDGAGAPWYLFGAQAAIVHGAARLTADVDVTVQLPPSMGAPALAAAIVAHGFQQRITDLDFMARTRVIPFVHGDTGLPLDIVLAGPGLEEQFFERRQVREIEGIQACVASAEDVVVMKVLAARPKDMDDVLAILMAQGAGLDVGYIRKTLTLLEQGLSQSDLLPAFEDALARAQK